MRAEAVPVLDAAVAALEASAEWTTAGIEAALKAALFEALELKPRKAFGPIRVAVTGASVSPPLFESLELLGRERSLGQVACWTRPRLGRHRGGVRNGAEIFDSLLVGPRTACGGSAHRANRSGKACDQRL